MHNRTPELIGSKEAARLRNVSRATFNRWVKAGLIKPVHQLNGKTGARLFDPEDVKNMREYA